MAEGVCKKCGKISEGRRFKSSQPSRCIFCSSVSVVELTEKNFEKYYKKGPPRTPQLSLLVSSNTMTIHYLPKTIKISAGLM